MRVTVRLFARLRDIAGAAELARDLAPGATIGTVWHQLADQYPELTPYARSISSAVPSCCTSWSYRCSTSANLSNITGACVRGCVGAQAQPPETGGRNAKVRNRSEGRRSGKHNGINNRGTRGYGTTRRGHRVYQRQFFPGN